MWVLQTMGYELYLQCIAYEKLVADTVLTSGTSFVYVASSNCNSGPVMLSCSRSLQMLSNMMTGLCIHITSLTGIYNWSNQSEPLKIVPVWC